MADLTTGFNRSPFMALLFALLGGTLLGLFVTFPQLILWVLAAGGVAWLTIRRFEPLWYFPVYSVVLLALDLNYATIAMWLSVGFVVFLGSTKALRHSAVEMTPTYTGVCKWWAIFLIARLLSALFSPFIGPSFNNWVHYAIAFIVFAAVYFIAQSIRPNRVMLHATLAGTLLSVLILWQVYRYYGGFHWVLFDRDMKFRVWTDTGLLFNVIPYVSGTVVPATLVLAWKDSLRWRRLLYLGCTALMVLAILFSNSRSAMLYVGSELGALGAWYVLRRNRKLAARGVTWVLAACATASVWISVYSDDGTVVSRRVLWQVAWDKLLTKPLIGWGPGTYFLGIEQFMPLDLFQRLAGLSDDLAGQAHNIFMNSLAETGLIGTVLIAVFIVLLLRYTTGKNLPVNALSVALVLSVLFMPVRGLFETSGLFGSANGLADFWSWGWVAITLAYLQRPEDGRRGED